MAKGWLGIGAVALLWGWGCTGEESADPLEVARACTASELVGQCPAGSSPVLGGQATVACEGAFDAGLATSGGTVSGQCVAIGSCNVFCQFDVPCTCGVRSISREEVVCETCEEQRCGDDRCEGTERAFCPEDLEACVACPKDCGDYCEAGSARCIGSVLQQCSGDGSRVTEFDCVRIGQVCQEGACVCGPGTELVGERCEPMCPPDQERVSGVCVEQCPQGQVRVGGVCTEQCPQGQEPVEGSCVDPCGAGEVRNESGDCECALGKELVEGACVDVCTPPEQERVGRGCANTSGYQPIEAGLFTMGSEDLGEEMGWSYAESPPHQVKLSRAFWMKTTPVTTGEWHAVVGNRPSSYAQECGDECPVENVTWYEAVEYANKLSEREGLQQCYTLTGCSGALGEGRSCNSAQFEQDCAGYRLPTEAEWEYAYRAGTTGAYYAQPVDEIAWHSGNSGERTQPVEQKQPNAWGLHDMAGNVYEWVWDWYDEDYYVTSPEEDPQGPESGSFRVLRGGSWGVGAEMARAAHRFFLTPGSRSHMRGFRLVRTRLDP